MDIPLDCDCRDEHFGTYLFEDSGQKQVTTSKAVQLLDNWLANIDKFIFISKCGPSYYKVKLCILFGYFWCRHGGFALQPICFLKKQQILEPELMLSHMIVSWLKYCACRQTLHNFFITAVWECMQCCQYNWWPIKFDIQSYDEHSYFH